MALSNEIDLTVEQLPQNPINPITLTPVDETDYNNLVCKPKVNSVILEGNKTSAQLGLASAEQGAKADSAVQPSDLSVYRTSAEQDVIDNGKQATLPDGTTGYFLQKTANGVQWSEVQAGGGAPTLTWYTGNTGTTVTISDTSSANLVKIYKNGILLEPTADYSISGTTLTLVTALVSTDKITVEVF